MKKKLYPVGIAVMILLMFSANSNGQDVPQPGDLLITEFLANPGAVSDTKGEWIELLNTSEKTLLLTDLLIKDDGSNKNTLEGDEPILLQAGEYFLMARSANSEENGGVTPDYIYSNYTLSNSEDEIILCLPDGTVLDQVKYDSGWQIASGASLELDPELVDSGLNDDAKNWNLASIQFGDGDMGSPGMANSSATGINRQGIVNYLEVYPNPCFGMLNIQLQLNEKVPVLISLINLVGQEINIFECDLCKEVSLVIDTEWLERGIWIIRTNYGFQTDLSKVLIF